MNLSEGNLIRRHTRHYRVPGKFLAVLVLGWTAVRGGDDPSGLEMSVLIFFASLLLIVSSRPQSRGGTSLLMAFVAATTLAPANFADAPMPLGAGIAAALLCGGLWTRRSHALHRLSNAGLQSLVVWGVALGAIVTFLVSSTNPGTLNLLTYFLYTVVLPISALLLGSRLLQSDLRAFSRGAILFAIVQTIFSSFDVLLGQRYPLWGYWLEGGQRSANSLLSDEFFRAQGLSSHSIVFSLCVLIGIFSLMTNVVQWKMATRIAAALILVSGLVLSGTRSAFLASLLIVAVYGLFEVRRISRKLIFAAFMLFTVVYFLQASTAAKFVDTLRVDLFGSASFTHRLDGLNAVGDVASSRGFLELLFGQGGASVSTLFARGYLQQDGFTVIDNQLVTTFIVAGLGGLFTLAVCILVGLIANRTIRVVMAGLFMMMFSFDVLTWPAGVVLFYAVVGAAVGVGRPVGSRGGLRSKGGRQRNRPSAQERVAASPGASLSGVSSEL